MNSVTTTPSKEGLLERLGRTSGKELESKLLPAVARVVELWGLPLLLVYALGRSLTLASRAPLWFDELLVREISRQGSLSAIWKVLKTGFDGQPPLFYLIERAAVSLVLSEQIGYRLPSILGLLCALACLYLFVRRSNGAIPALTSSLLLLITPLFSFYVADAKPYCLVMACIAAAMVCYQRAPAAPWVGGLFLALFLACSVNYYAVLSVAPFFVAEIVFAWMRGRVRYGVWSALIAAPIPIVVGWPQLAQLRQAYSQHFIFPNPGLNSLPKAYGSYFRMESPWATALVVIAVLVMFVAFFRNPGQPNETEEAQAVRVSERALVLGVMLVPVVGYLLAKIAHAPFVDRYVLSAILGLAAALGYFLGRANLKTQMTCALFILLAVGSQELGVWSSHMRIFNTPIAQTNLIAELSSSVDHQGLPIVVSDLGAYVEFWHYAPSGLRKNVFGLVDPVNAVAYSGTDNLDKLAILWRAYEPVAFEDFAKFAGEHSSFLLLSNGSPFDWWPARLVHDGDNLRLLRVQGQYKVYLVELVHTSLANN